MNAGQVTSPTESSNDATPIADDAMLMYVQLRPRWAAKEKCLAALEGLAQKHPAVQFAVAGLSKDARYLHITLAVSLGSRTEIARHSPVAQDAYLFVSALFSDMFDFLPQYTAEPTAEMRAAAEAVSLSAHLDEVRPALNIEQTAAPAVAESRLVGASSPRG